ncbi:MAG TPA: diguanylate cyclase [Candidatus Acidoferrum sp.]|jgi:diguanylate cyclase (GGDEF)-like protein
MSSSVSKRSLRILVAEGSAGEASQVLRKLFFEREDSLELTVVSSITTLLPTIGVVSPEIILLDLKLAQPDPADGARRVHRSAPGVPLIVFADSADKHQAANCLTVGAMDYMLKGFMDAHTVERVLRGALERNTLEGLADLLRDPVTNLYRREALLTLGSRAREEAHRTGSTLVLLCAMIENLNTLRDGFGPGAAEHALHDVATLLEQSCRRSDLVARIGEAQFALLAVDAVAPSAQVLLQRVEKHLMVQNQTRSPWGPIDMRVRVGVWSAPDDRSFVEFLDEVEAELRQVPAETAI